MKKLTLFILLLFLCSCGVVKNQGDSVAENFIIYKIDRFTGGLNLKNDSVVLSNGINIGQAIDAVNVDFRDGNSIQSRDGFTKLIDNTYTKSVVGIFPFYIGITRHLIVLTFSYLSLPGTATLDSTVVLINDTSDLYVGQYVDLSSFFSSGSHEIISINPNSYIVVDEEATGNGALIVSTPYPVLSGLPYTIFDSTTSKKTGTASAVYFNPAVYNDLCYISHYGNSDDEDYNLKYDGSSITKMGIDAPLNACSGVGGSSGSSVYAGTDLQAELLRYDGSSSLDVVAERLGGAQYIYALAEFDSNLYGGTDDGRLLRWDNSSAWVEVAAKATASAIRSLVVLGSYLYGAGDDGVLQKWDGTSQWEVVATDPGSLTIYKLIVHNAGSGDKIYAGGSDGHLYEWNGSDAWVSVVNQYFSEQIRSFVVFDFGSGDMILAGTTSSGYLLSWDNVASSWVEKGQLSSGTSILSLCVYDSGSGDHVYAGSNKGELFEWNGTDTLTSVSNAPQVGCYDLITFSSDLYGAVGSYLYRWNDSDAWVSLAYSGGEILRSLDDFSPPGNLDGSYFYYYTFVNSATGDESAFSPISQTMIASDQQIALINIAASTDSQVDKKRIYRTGGTLSTINFIAEIDNATTTYTDNIADTSVGNLEDCSNNDVLSAVKTFSIHHHQCFAGFSEDEDGYVYDSRFYLPSAFPSDYNFKIGNEADPIVQVSPLGIDMIAYTSHHTFRLRYIGANEGDIIMEEVAAVGLASDNTLATGIDQTGNPFHVFLGQSAMGRGIYVHTSVGVTLISRVVDPIFTGERSDVTAIAWPYVGTCCAAFAGNKYYLAYPESGEISPNKILCADFSFSQPVFTLHDFDAMALVYDLTADQLIFGGTAKEVYVMGGTADWISGVAADIDLIYQTPYFGDRNNDAQIKEIRFNADTQGDTLTIKVYADYSLVQTITCSSNSMERIILKTDPTVCFGKMFSIRFEISSQNRIKISPPLEVQVIPYKKY